MRKLLLIVGFVTVTRLLSVTAQVVNPSPALTEGAIVMDSTMTMDEDSLKKNTGNATMKKEGMHHQKTKEEKKQKPMNKKKAE